VTLQSYGRRQARRDPIARRIRQLAPWFHDLHLPSGHRTAPDHPLGDFPAVKWRELAPALPADLAGWSVLDVGCNAGFYAFELAGRGAEVLAIDADEHYLAQARWAAGQLDPAGRVTFERRQVYDLARSDRAFDLVLFLGVLYHLRHPLLALDLLAERTRRLLVLQTLTTPGDAETLTPLDLPYEERERLRLPGWPRMSFLERRFAGDPTNWWAPDAACVEAMLRSSGLEVTARPGYELWVCRPRGVPAHVRDELRAVFREG
jgi:tRNA (mo5U34)-methyltransferase